MSLDGRLFLFEATIVDVIFEERKRVRTKMENESDPSVTNAIPYSIN